MSRVRVLGVDPGLTATGFGVVESQGSALKLLQFGTVKTDASRPLAQRLDTIYQALEQVIARWQPDAGAIEDVFNNKNFQSAVKLAYVRATAMVACNLHKVPVYEYSPATMKKSIAGYGQAEKGQVQQMVQRLLGLSEPPKPFDAADALGHALCHLQHVPLLQHMGPRR
jgi:crossover junction endodeoxyribonuclease RuvC